MSKSQVDQAEARAAGPMRPRDAATLIVLDRRGDEVFVLMGRRHARHVFMPGKFVFPGGRTDRSDGRVPVAEDLAPVEAARMGSPRARAIALSAVRETYEEAGLLVGVPGDFSRTEPGWDGFCAHGVRPSLGALRLVARAITPPGRVRRYDTRFLACWLSAVAKALPEGGPTDELEEIAWLPLGEAKQADVPAITRTILNDLDQRLADDPLLAPGAAVPYYRMIRNRSVRDII